MPLVIAVKPGPVRRFTDAHPADGETARHSPLIERRFAALTQWRGIATRYDKLATAYQSAAVFNAVIAWTQL